MFTVMELGSEPMTRAETVFKSASSLALVPAPAKKLSKLATCGTVHTVAERGRLMCLLGPVVGQLVALISKVVAVSESVRSSWAASVSEPASGARVDPAAAAGARSGDAARARQV